MDADVINPFIESTVNVLKVMAATSVTIGAPSVKVHNRTWGVVTGVIGLAGYQASGNMILSFDKPSILSIVSNMLGEKFSTIDDQVADAVGELTNMVSGGAKGKLSDMGFFFEMAVPLVVLGQNTEIKQLTKAPIIVVPFDTGNGKLVLEASLKK